MSHARRNLAASAAARAFAVCASAGLVFAPSAGAQVPDGVAPPAVIVSATELGATMQRSAANNTLDIKVAETPVKGGLIRVAVIYRTRPETRALIHQELTEIYYIVEGGGTLMTGGTVEGVRQISDPPNLGPTPSFFVTQIGGDTQHVGVGDMVILPAGLPHRLSELDGPTSYIVYRFEGTQPR